MKCLEVVLAKKKEEKKKNKLGERRRTAVFTRGLVQASDSVSHEAEKKCEMSLLPECGDGL